MNFDTIKNQLNKVDKELIEETKTSSYIDKINAYILNTAGKKIRPMLLISSYSIFKNNAFPKNIIKLSSAIEIIHIASMIHDDLIDDAKYRRGKKTLHILWGNKVSTLVGDFLYAKASFIASKYGNNEICKIISNAVSNMCKGEIRELMNSNNVKLTEKEYMNIAREKTGELFSAACEIGAVCAKADKKYKNIMRNFGLDIGVAFQITDDILDITSNINNLGKATQTDLKDGKITLPLIYTFRRLNKKEKKALIKSIKNAKYSDIVNMFHKYKAIEYAKRQAERYIYTAKGYITPILNSSEKVFDSIANVVINRRR